VEDPAPPQPLAEALALAVEHRRRTGDDAPVLAALQIVTDNASMLMDSVTVLLHRLGVAYKAIMNPVFRARRGPSGELLAIEPASDAPFGDGIDEIWIHVQLAESVDHAVGVRFFAKRGDTVLEGDDLAEVHARTDETAERAAAAVLAAYEIGDRAPADHGIVLDIVA